MACDGLWASALLGALFQGRKPFQLTLMRFGCRHGSPSLTPHALIDGLMLVFKHPDKAGGLETADEYRPGYRLWEVACERILYTAWMSNG